jgi:hypothetical protein
MLPVSNSGAGYGSLTQNLGESKSRRGTTRREAGCAFPRLPLAASQEMFRETMLG